MTASVISSLCNSVILPVSMLMFHQLLSSGDATEHLLKVLTLVTIVFSSEVHHIMTAVSIKCLKYIELQSQLFTVYQSKKCHETSIMFYVE